MFTSIWLYQVAPEHRTRFMAEYGPTGAWADLFRGSAGYRETILFQDLGDPERFVTLDRWDSRAAFEAFRALETAAYEALDARTAGLTISEYHLGMLET